MNKEVKVYTEKEAKGFKYFWTLFLFFFTLMVVKFYTVDVSDIDTIQKIPEIITWLGNNKTHELYGEVLKLLIGFIGLYIMPVIVLAGTYIVIIRKIKKVERLAKVEVKR